MLATDSWRGRASRRAAFLLAILSVTSGALAQGTVVLRGRVVDAETGSDLPARVYVQRADGRWFHVRSASPAGAAVAYRKRRFEVCAEVHTTISAHPFVAELPPGDYVITAERGKEYFAGEREVELAGDPVAVRLELRRWIDMAARGWYSGDTHVHRTLDELPDVMLAEDLNVGLPITAWVRRAGEVPADAVADLPRDPIRVDATHVICPRNTEYEIFSVGERRHTLGAVLILNHRRPFETGAPPVAPIAAAARAQGALLDLDKHSWPWSLMLVPVMRVELFELANNHLWRTEFGFRKWTLDAVPGWMEVERDDRGFTERGWLDFGLQTWYALLNCGFRLRPSAGTATGVHPVPLGYSRVYVQLAGELEVEPWIAGLRAGRSFVTNGPMLFVEVDGEPPGHVFAGAPAHQEYRIEGSVVAPAPLERVEVVVSGEVARSIDVAAMRREPSGAFAVDIDERIRLRGSGWIAVRCFERRAGGRVRFAHSSPVFVDVPGLPLRPRRIEVDWLSGRMRAELARNRDVLAGAALDEYRAALRVYERLARDARD